MKTSSFTRLRLAGFVAVALAGGMFVTAPALAEAEKGAADPTLLAGPKAEKKAAGEKRQRSAEMGAESKKGFAGERAGKGQNAQRMHEALFKGITLTDAQRDQLRAAMAQNQAEMKAWREANGEKLKALQEQGKTARESGDKQAMAAVRAEMKTLHESMPQRGDHAESIKAILTPEQVAQFDANVAELKAQRQQRMGEGKAAGERPQKMKADGESKQRAEGERKQKPEGERKQREGRDKLDME